MQTVTVVHSITQSIINTINCGVPFMVREYKFNFSSRLQALYILDLAKASFVYDLLEFSIVVFVSSP